MLNRVRENAVPADVAKLLIPHIDLTLLEESAKESEIDKLCQRGTTELGAVAAICIFVQHTQHAKSLLLNTPIKLATVANFHQGNFSLTSTSETIECALHCKVDEIDLVLPYELFLEGNIKKVENYLSACEKLIHPHAKLKIILETGALQSEKNISEASKLAINIGADFLKTSTGKIAVGATLEAALAMLNAIKASGANVGFKASGGVKTPKEAYEYFCLTEFVLEKKPDANLFRLGASRLLDELLSA